MSDETTGNEPALSTGLSGNEPVLGGPLGDGRSSEQLTDDEARQAGIFRFRFNIPYSVKAWVESDTVYFIKNGKEVIAALVNLDTQTELD